MIEACATRRSVVRVVSVVSVVGVGLAVALTSACDPLSSTPLEELPPVSPTPEADPDRAALDEALALTVNLAKLCGAVRSKDSQLRALTRIHAAHLTVLDQGGPSPAQNSPGPLKAAVVRTHEAAARDRLAELSLAAHSGAVARLFASMSAAIAAALVAPR